MARRHIFALGLLIVLRGGLASAATDYVGYWRFDDNALDSSPSLNDGTLLNGASFAAGQVLDALKLDGSSGAVALSHSVLNHVANWTFQAWVYPTGGRMIYSEGNPAVTFQILRESTGNLLVSAWNQSYVPNSWLESRSPGGVLPLNQWTLLTITLENGVVGGGTVRFYINRTFVGSGPLQIESHPTSNFGMFGDNVGAWYGGTQAHDYLAGMLDEVQIFTRAMPATEVCSGAYKLCGATCIAATACCLNADCVTPANGCYKTQGTCNLVTRVCSYAYDNAAPCNADNDKCTPNDSCLNGVCIADQRVVCKQLECHGPSTCTPSTGNCDSTVLNSGSCGGTGCTQPGTCSAGVCSGAALKDCSGNVPVCQTGVCNLSNAQCETINVRNDTPCTSSNKCLLATACSGGACVGQIKSCTASSACMVAACNPTTGACEETPVAAGVACTGGSECAQDQQCDGVGHCQGGDHVADGTPCTSESCAAAMCVAGACACGMSVAASDMGALGQYADGSAAEPAQVQGGCEVGGRRPTSPGLLLAVFLLVMCRRSRRAAR